MLALGPLFVMIQPLIINILSVFILLGEDNILVCILITTHLFDSILGSKEGPMSYAFSQPPVHDNLIASYQDIISLHCTVRGG